MKWIDFYIILVVTAILRILIHDNMWFILSGLPLGVFMGYRRAEINLANLRNRKDEEK